METLKYYGMNKRTIYLQQDNDPKHKSKSTMSWLQQNKVQYINDWPPNSPDLNPIEHVWHLLKLRLSLYERKARNIDELWERVDFEWNKLDKDVCRSYIDSMSDRIAALLTESRVPLSGLVPVYDPKDSINNWFQQYDRHCTRLGRNSEQKLRHIGPYLPPAIASWVSRSPRTQTWSQLKDALIKAYGFPPLKHKQIVRSRLESLRQGKMPSRQFAVLFEDILLDFPDGHSLDADTLRAIYLRVMNPGMRKLILPNVPHLATWTAINESAVSIEESVALDEAILERDFANLSLGAPSSPALPPIAASASDPSPMEIDAFQRSSRSGSSTSPSGRSRVSGATRSQPRGRDTFRRWTDDGRPICGHCDKVGHLSKKCRQRSHQSINQVELSSETDGALSVSQPTVNTVQMPMADSDKYAAVSIEDDPILAQSSITAIAPAVSPEEDAVSTPRIQITLQGYRSRALVDTGANISALRTSVAEKLGLSIDKTTAATFTIADNSGASSRGTVRIQTMIGPIDTTLVYHVVDTLSHPVILGYPQLKRLGAIIDTSNNQVRFPLVDSGLSPTGVSGFSGRPGLSGASSVVPSVCSMVSSLRLPGQHHAYVDIRGTPNSAAFVSTPPEVAATKCLSIAAGFVNFDKDGIATVQLANLGRESKHINKGQKIASYQYLSPSLRIYSINKSTESSVKSSASPTVDFSPYIGKHLSPSEREAMQALLQEFPDCFNSKPTSVTPLVKHDIDTGESRPLSQPPYRASAAENETIDSLLDDMLKQGIIRPSNSPWSSPVVIVRKHDGSPRFCVDYRRLNAVTTKDVYPLPRIDDTVHSLGQAKVFSTLDFTSSYWQIELDDAAKPKSAFICRRGLYEFVRMPFGLTNAPATMQRLMDSVLAGLKWQVCLVYLDDIICFSSSLEQHLVDLRSVLTRLRDASLTVNLKKCKFACDRISFLGYVISPSGLHTDPEKIRAVADFPQPVDVPSLRSFLGLAGYYRCFISKFAAIAAPLNDLLKKDATWTWSDTHQQAFGTLKTALTSAPVLRFPDFSHPFELHTDGACTAGIGVILCQRDPRNNRAYAVAFASRSLSPAERNYGVSEVEALAVVWGIKKFAPYLASTTVRDKIT
ncbi:hypothetical protein G6F38_010280 [Rhizopus arrhizus]|nr:hypothetical protein G6F38_010280 [Rhizopus arrhizus]